MEKPRTFLKPRSRDAMANMANNVTPEEVISKDALVVESIPEETHTSTEAPVPKEATDGGDNLPTEISTTVEDDDDWMDSLTPIEEPPTPESPSESPPEPEPDGATAEAELAEIRRKERMLGLETVDPEVAQEIYATIIAPELEAIKERENARIAALEAKFSTYDSKHNELIEDKTLQIRRKTNDAIFAKYPKADKILKSAEFIEFVNKDSDPYQTDTKFDRLKRAYATGDADYVMRELDGFVATRSKPKPQVNVDTASGGATTPKTSSKGKKMSDAEYSKLRKQITGAPRGTYPPDALSKLVQQYMSN